MLVHILQYALSISADLAFAFPALLLMGKLSPAMEEAAAKTMGATATTLPSCHLATLEEPAKVAAVIDEGAKKSLHTMVSA